MAEKNNHSSGLTGLENEPEDLARKMAAKMSGKVSRNLPSAAIRRLLMAPVGARWYGIGISTWTSGHSPGSSQLTQLCTPLAIPSCTTKSSNASDSSLPTMK